MEDYNLILSNSAKNGRKIHKNEVFSLVLRFRPWPCAHFGLGMGSRVHTLALAWASHVHTLGLAWAAVCTLWPWHGQPCAHFGLGIGKPCAHFGLGMGSRVHTLALAWADFGLGRATLASEKKKRKSFSEFAQILHGSL